MALYLRSRYLEDLILLLWTFKEEESTPYILGYSEYDAIGVFEERFYSFFDIFQFY
jgi:hypothetical protein